MSNKPPLFINHKELIPKILGNLTDKDKPLSIHLELLRDILTTINGSFQYLSLPDELPEKTELMKSVAQQGKPYFDIDTIAINVQQIRELFRELLRVAENYMEFSGSDSEIIQSSVTSNEIMQHTIVKWFNDTSKYHNLNNYTNNFGGLAYTIIHGAMYPLLTCYSDILQLDVPQESWYKNYCPICGGYPDISYLDKEKGARWLICSRCDANWMFYRLVCPFCGNDDIKNLAYYKSENNPYRLYICELCNRYIKCIDLRNTDNDILVPLERVTTLELDNQAQKLNYQ